MTDQTPTNECDERPDLAHYQAEWSKRGYEPHIATLLAKDDWSHDLIEWLERQLENMRDAFNEGMTEGARLALEGDSTAEPPAVTWPQSKGDPIGPVWFYGGKKGMYQAEALRMMAHDLVERIKWLEAEPRAVLKQAQDIDGVDTFALIKALHKTIDGQRKHIASLQKASGPTKRDSHG